MSKTEQLDILQIVKGDNVSTADFAKTLKVFLSSVRSILDEIKQSTQSDKKDIENKLTNVLSEFKLVDKSLRSELKQLKDNLPKDKTAELKQELTRDLAKAIKEIDDRINSIETEDFDSDEIQKNIESNLPKYGEAFRDGLELLQDEDRLSMEAIRDLKEEFVKLRNQIVNSNSGGVTNMRIRQAFKLLLKTEQPTGDIDGANTEYTLTQPIFAILSMSINGETIAQLPNYTISGNKFTFSVALPAVYSGKDWEVKYI